MTDADEVASVLATRKTEAGNITTKVTIEYIGDLLDELCTMSSYVGQRNLTWLLSLAREEARIMRRLTLDDGVTHSLGSRLRRSRAD